MSNFGPTSAQLPRTSNGLPVTIVSATNANPCQINFGAVRHGYADGNSIMLSGFTGLWTPLNTTLLVLIVDPFKLTVPINSTAFGAVTGVPVAIRPGQAIIDGTSWDQRVDDSKNWKENVNGGGFILANVSVIGKSLGIFGSLPLTFPLINDGDSADRTFPLVGALINSPVIPSWPSTLEGGLGGNMFVSAPGVIKVRLVNNSGGPITPAVQTFGATANCAGVNAASASLTFPAIADGDSAVQTFAMTGAVAGSPLIPILPSTLEGGLSVTMLATGTGIVSVRIVNSSGGPITPAVQVFGAVGF